jgi:hypothetical protein
MHGRSDPDLLAFRRDQPVQKIDLTAAAGEHVARESRERGTPIPSGGSGKRTTLLRPCGDRSRHRSQL